MNVSIAGSVRGLTAVALVLVLAVPTVLFAAAEVQKAPEWVERSNKNAQLLLELDARFMPESAARNGVEGIDDKIFDLKPGFNERRRAALVDAVAELKKRLGSEKDPHVREDLYILVKNAEDNIRGIDIDQKYDMAYFKLPQLVFGSMRGLLDDQVPEQRRGAAVVRMKRYAGLEQGYEPITKLAKDYMAEKNKRPGLLPPVKLEVEKDLANANSYLDGIRQLFEKYPVAGWEEPYTTLRKQLEDYNQYVRAEVLPKARTDFRLPEEEYSYSLSQYGIDIPPAQLAAKARAAFADIQKQMQALAPKVAKQRGYSATDYRDVIRELKKKQLTGDAILPHYEQRLKQIEEIVAREHLVTLPTRPARIRLASAAESAAVPAPNMRPPRLLGNTGEQGTFMLPLNIPAPPGSKEATQKFDDFTFEAASWTLTAHEARPGHEMQFASIIEHGVSIARAMYAFNSTNVEGWGLYAEYITLPYMPADGQLISLQHRLLRAARAFLDPELQLGKVTRDQAFAILKNDVVLSDAMATQEVDRYTFRSPGQAPSYFYGYTHLVALRNDAQKALGAGFNQQRFHDFVLAQGLLPPDLMRAAVMDEFVPSQKASRSTAAGN